MAALTPENKDKNPARSTLPKIPEKYKELQYALDNLESGIHANEHFGGLFTPQDTVEWEGRTWNLDLKNHAVWSKLTKGDHKISPKTAGELAQKITGYLKFVTDTQKLITENRELLPKYQETLKEVEAHPYLKLYQLGEVVGQRDLGFYTEEETLGEVIKQFKETHSTIVLAKTPTSYRDNFERLSSIHSELSLIIDAVQGVLVAEEARTKAAQVIGETPEVARHLGFEGNKKMPEQPIVPEKPQEEEFTDTYTGT